ncbi:helix-turn-helix domain-containing protein [Cryptosporangium sp. NPDC048952]|uniref:helix-turn-helix domain-containing protein n=1 Tax=Cryptosporangium sp. NPDC048952 TaxID=3363961 RepID=UPI00371639FF
MERSGCGCGSAGTVPTAGAAGARSRCSRAGRAGEIPFHRGVVGSVPRSRAKKKLLAELVRWRKEAGLTQEEAAAVKFYDKSPATLSNLEAGKTRIRSGDVHNLLNGYRQTGRAPELTPEVIDDLVQLAHEIAKAPRGWFEPLLGPGTAPVFRELLAYEAEAAVMQSWQPTLVPGLLQTEAYARALMKASPLLHEPEEIERQVKIRIERQSVLDRKRGAPQLRVVLWEAALRPVIGGPAVMRDQLERLREASERYNVTVQLLPFSAGAHPVLNGGEFQVFTFADPTDQVVYSENHTEAVHREMRDEVEQFTRLIEDVRSLAESVSATRDRIAEFAAVL